MAIPRRAILAAPAAMLLSPPATAAPSGSAADAFTEALAAYRATLAKLKSPEALVSDETLDAAIDENARAALRLLCVPARGPEQARELLEIGFRWFAGSNIGEELEPVALGPDLLNDDDARHRAFLAAALKALSPGTTP